MKYFDRPDSYVGVVTRITIEDLIPFKLDIANVTRMLERREGLTSGVFFKPLLF
jgi:hypothetical protein